MISFAANHRTQGHQRIKTVRLRHILQRQRHLQRAGHGGYGDVAIGHAHFHQFFGAHFKHGAADFVGKTGLYDADIQACAVVVGWDDGHVRCSVVVK